jgi:hypothetical protein
VRATSASLLEDYWHVPLLVHVFMGDWLQSAQEPPVDPQAVTAVPAAHTYSGATAPTDWQHPPLQGLEPLPQPVVH